MEQTLLATIANVEPHANAQQTKILLASAVRTDALVLIANVAPVAQRIKLPESESQLLTLKQWHTGMASRKLSSLTSRTNTSFYSSIHLTSLSSVLLRSFNTLTEQRISEKLAVKLLEPQ